MDHKRRAEAEPGGGSASAGLSARKFLERDRATTQAVARLVRQIVAFRGYRIPAEQRDDVAQEVLTDLWRRVLSPGFELDRPLEGLVQVMATRRSIDWLRGRRPTAALDLDLPDGGVSPLEATLEAERSEAALVAFRNLRETCRELILLRAQEKSYREISAIVGRSVATLRVQFVRCIKQAQRQLAASGIGPKGTGATARSEDDEAHTG